MFTLYYSKLSWKINYFKNYHKDYHNHMFALYHSKLSWKINYFKNYHKDYHNHVLSLIFCLVSWLRNFFAWFVLLRRNEFFSIKASFFLSLYKIKCWCIKYEKKLINISQSIFECSFFKKCRFRRRRHHWCNACCKRFITRLLAFSFSCWDLRWLFLFRLLDLHLISLLNFFFDHEIESSSMRKK